MIIEKTPYPILDNNYKILTSINLRMAKQYLYPYLSSTVMHDHHSKKYIKTFFTHIF